MRDSHQHINLNTCVLCGYRPCRCPFYAENDRYEIGYDELYIIDDDSEDW